MAKQVQFRRGTAVEHEDFTGAEGEITVNTTDFSLRVHDGITVGGHAVSGDVDLTGYATEAYVNNAISSGGGTVNVSYLVSFPSTTELKAATLTAGDVVMTNGYYAAGDGGQAEYVIMSSADYGNTPDGYGDHVLSNGNIAVLVYQYRANILQFGAFNDGQTDNYAPFIAATNAEIPLEFPSNGNFKLAYDDSKYGTPIIFKNNVDFNNSTISITGINARTPAQSGYIIVLSTDSYGQWTNHNGSSALVTALKTDPTVSGKYWSGLNDNAEFANCYLKINTNEPSYTYRGQTYNREEFLVHTRDGQMTSALKYELNTSSITSVDVLPISRTYTTYENLTVDLTDADTTLSRYVHVVDASNIRINNINYTLDNSRVYSQPAGPVLFSVINSCFVEVDGLYSGTPIKNVVNSAVTYTYVFSMGGCYDIKWKNVVAQGDGWGSSGNDNCRRVTLENCDINRIDFHRPFYEYLNVKNCTLGNWGIKVTAIGDLNIEDSTFNIDQAPFYPYRGIVTTRGDAGGWTDGHLYINKCTFNNNSGVAVNVQRPETGNEDTQPAGTSTVFWNWESQTIQNCIVGAGEIVVGNWSAGESYLIESETISVNNVRCSDGAKLSVNSGGINGNNSRLFKQDISSIASPRYYNAPANRNIVIRDCDIDTVSLNHDTELCVMNVTIDNIRGNNGNGTVVNISQQGVYNIANSTLDSVSFSNATLPIKANIENNVIHTSVGQTPVGSISNSFHGGRGDDVRIKNNVIWIDSVKAAAINPYTAMLSGKCSENTVTIEGQSTTTVYRPSWPSSNIVGVVTNIDYRNTVQFDAGLVPGSETPWTNADYKSAEMSLPRVVGQSTFAVLDATNNATITMTAANQMTLNAGSLDINALRYKL